MFSLFEFFETFRGLIFSFLSSLPIAIGDRFVRHLSVEGIGVMTMFGGKLLLSKSQIVGLSS